MTEEHKELLKFLDQVFIKEEGGQYVYNMSINDYEVNVIFHLYSECFFLNQESEMIKLGS